MLKIEINGSLLFFSGIAFCIIALLSESAGSLIFLYPCNKTLIIRHIRKQEQGAGRAGRGKGKSTVIKGSEVDYYLYPYEAYDEDYIKKYILERYPTMLFFKNKSNQERNCPSRAIRQLISAAYKEELAGQDISVKTALYINEDLDVKIKGASPGRRNVKLYDILEPIHDAPCSSITRNEIIDAIDKTVPERTEACFIEIMHAVYNLFSAVVGEEAFNTSDLKAFFDDEDAFTKELTKLRKALGKKHLSLEEFHKLYEEIVSRLDKHPIYYGVLIRLFTGLESHIVASLCWKDYKHDPN